MSSKHRASETPRKPVFLTMGETAQLLGLKRDSLKHYRSNRPHKSPPSVKHGKLVAYELQTVIDWVARNRPLDLDATLRRAEALR